MQHLFRVLRTVKNVININSLFIVFEVNLIREAPNKNATKGIKANRVTERRGGDQRISLVQAAQEFLTQPGFLLLVSVIAMRDVGQRLGEQNKDSMHDQTGCAPWSHPTIHPKQDWP